MKSKCYEMDGEIKKLTQKSLLVKIVSKRQRRNIRHDRRIYKALSCRMIQRKTCSLRPLDQIETFSFLQFTSIRTHRYMYNFYSVLYTLYTIRFDIKKKSIHFYPAPYTPDAIDSHCVFYRGVKYVVLLPSVYCVYVFSVVKWHSAWMKEGIGSQTVLSSREKKIWT